jgi:spermidine synthase
LNWFTRNPARSGRRATAVEVSETGGIRSLHIGSDTVQSSMKVADPVELVLSYTRAMMGFLLFHREPRHFVMIGLGGGSLAKYAYHHHPAARVTSVENNPEVIAVARSMFAVPQDDARFTVISGDGGAWVAEHPASCDVLMVDAYDSKAQVEELATEDFYTQARDALEPDGVLVVNLWSTDPRFDVFLQRVERAFEGLVICLPAERKGNVAVFGFRRRPSPTRWDQLKAQARLLEIDTGIEFQKFVGRLADLNAHSEHRLLV